MLIALAAALVLAAPPALTFRVDARPANIAPSVGCPDGRTRVPLQSAAGTPIGTSTGCLTSVTKTDRPGYVIGSVTALVVQTDALRNGTIVSRAVYRFVWIARDGSLAKVTITGRVVGGSGRYAGARGVITGSGRQTVDDRGGRLRLQFSVRLR